MSTTSMHLRDDRKSAALASRLAVPMKNTVVLSGFSEIREVFRSNDSVQAMPGAEFFGSQDNPDKLPVIYVEGEAHRKRRKAIAPFFTPKAIKNRYNAIIYRLCDELVSELRAEGTARIDVDGFRLAVAVAAEVVGLTETSNSELAARLDRMLSGEGSSAHTALSRLVGKLKMAWRMNQFWRKDVAPAVAVRRREPREDVLSQMVATGCSKQAILVECFIYGIAGMLTTRELISMCTWHMLENEDLRQSFVAGSEDEQNDIIEEILRLEPIVGMLFRDVNSPGNLKKYSLDIRAANLDEAVTGPNPFAIEPGRWRRAKATSGFMSFGDGNHRCPGAQLSLHESRIYLDQLMRVPGLKLAHTPRLEWNEPIRGYEVRDVVVTCDRG